MSALLQHLRDQEQLNTQAQSAGSTSAAAAQAAAGRQDVFEGAVSLRGSGVPPELWEVRLLPFA